MSSDRLQVSKARRFWRGVLLGAAVGLLGACQAIVPLLSQLGIAFGQDLMATASVNYSPRYAMQIEQLLVAMAREMTGMQFQAQLAAAGYVPPPPGYANAAAAGGYGQQGAYGQPQYSHPGSNPYGQPQQDPYAAQNPYGQPQQQDPYAAQNPYGQPQQQDPYAAQNPYGQPQQQDPYAAQNPYGQPQPQDPNAAQNPYGQPPSAPQDPYAGNPYGQQPQAAQGPNAQQTNPYGYPTRSIAPVQVSIDLLVSRGGASAGAALETIEDGAVLRDGGGDPSRGDRLKIRFTANCACFVYLIGIDATGYVARLFPDPDLDITNPVASGVEYLLPGEGEWWGLDEHRGVEQIHVVASYVQRPDIEQALDALTAEKRQPVASYRGVTHAVEMPSTRGLVKVKDAPPVTVGAGQGGAVQVAPTSFLGGADQIGVVATRWFRHTD